ncbi:MAG: hypothetical protein JO362_18675 [Streptomycetaceae bacterium]|nr:hypothetical protein [Streptomycetaceae bacterium]
MPRPTPAQFVYGSATVVFSTLAMLLLSQTSSGVGVIAIALTGLALGVLVAVMAALPRGARAAPRTTAPAPSPDAPDPPPSDLPSPPTANSGSTGAALSKHSLRP